MRCGVGDVNVKTEFGCGEEVAALGSRRELEFGGSRDDNDKI
jgi:hypothetical protein